MESETKRHGKAVLAAEQMIVLDYFFGQGKSENGYQLVLFPNTETWNVLYLGRLISRLDRIGQVWSQQYGGLLEDGEIIAIGSYIENQYMDHLPNILKNFWPNHLQEVILQGKEEYLIICKADIDFEYFRKQFNNFLGQLSENHRKAVFKVYNADFSDEFVL